MGRPGFTEDMVAGMRADGVTSGPHFVVGPTLDDISSSDARKALMAGTGSEDLQTILHPKVIEWHRTCDFTYRVLDQEPEPAEHDVPALAAGGAKRGRDAAC